MKKFGSLLVKLLTAVIIASSISPACVYGEEIIPVEDGDLNIPELADDANGETAVELEDIYSDTLTAAGPETDGSETKEPVTENLTADELPNEDMTAGDASDKFTGTSVLSDTTGLSGASEPITKIDAPKKTEYSFEYKSALVSIQKKLPKTVRVYRGDLSETINISWKCEKDYNDDLDEYPFVPDMTGYRVAKDAKLPCITVRFEKEWPEMPEGALMDDTPITMPVPEIMNQMSMGTFPSKYSNKDELPAARDQGDYGTCWAFANIAAVEADLIMDGTPKNSIDLSELQLAYYGWNTYKDPKKCKTISVKHNKDPKTYLNVGGAQRQAARLLANHIGAVTESKVPYTSAKSFSGGKGGNEYLTAKDSVHIKSVYYIDNNDRNGIKRAVILHGAVATSYGHNNQYYDSVNNSYYNPKGRRDGEGHAIAVVGWDDDFPKEDFLNIDGLPKGNGAWLVRNSWGPDWGEDGYFWMSYYDAGLGGAPYGVGYYVAYDAVKGSADNCYSYDGENIKDWGSRVWGKELSVRQTFSVSAGEAVKSIGFELLSADVNARVTVKNKKTGETATGSIRTSYAGFYTVKLKRSLYISSKSNVEVTIDLSSKNTILYPVEFTGDLDPVETKSGIIRLRGICDKGFEVKREGSSSFAKVKSNDSRIKVYTVKSKAPKKISVQSVSLNKKKSTIKKGKTLQLKAKIIPTNATNKKVTWSTSNKKIATVTQKGVVKGIKAGSATIKVTTKDGKKKAKCKITVKKK